jgi:3-hydroxybutyrate dehydrogenase
MSGHFKDNLRKHRWHMLKGRSALITGSVAGIGHAVARALAAAGCNVALTGIDDRAAGEARAAALAVEFGIRAFYAPADLRRRDEVSQLADTCLGRLGAIDILVNNAVVRHFAQADLFSAEHWDEALAVNLSAPFLLIKSALPHMRQRGFGRIVNMSSIAAVHGITKRIDYSTTKSGLLGMTRVVALENVNSNITCNALMPGSVLTPYSDARIQALMADRSLSRDEAVQEFLRRRQPAGRFVEPAGIAALVVFLCSESARDITGAALPIDIGFTAGSAIEGGI